MSLRSRYVINIALFQCGWIACVLFSGQYLLVLLITVALLFIHVRWILVDKREWILIAGFAAFGFFVDALLIRFEVMHTANSFPPVWLLCLWLLFSTTLSHSLSWLGHRLTLAALFAAIAAPSSYYAGAKLTTVSLNEPVWFSLFPIAFFWSFYLPFGLYAARHLSSPATVAAHD